MAAIISWGPARASNWRETAALRARPRRHRAKLREHGARHVACGARPEHYPVVGGVLIASMEEIAGEAWRVEYGRARCEAFGIAAGAMIEGAESVGLEAAA